MSDKLTQLETWQSQMLAYERISLHTSTRMGAHWIAGHFRADDLTYFQKLVPAWTKVVSTDPNRIREALAFTDQNGKIVVRNHPLSEQQSDYTRDPAGTGKAHADSYHSLMSPGGRLYGISTERLLFSGINEPDLNSEAADDRCVIYTTNYLDRLNSYGLFGTAVNGSTGHVRNTDTATVKNTKPTWVRFRSLETRLLKGNYLTMHEYWRDFPAEGWYTAPNGQRWGWNAYRHYACELSVPILIGECGLTKNVNGLPGPGQSDGWIGNISPVYYAAQLWEYANQCHPNVVAVMPFTTSYESNDWQNDDTQPAHSEILARKSQYFFPVTWPVKMEAPVVTPPPVGTMSDPDLLIFPKVAQISLFFGQLYKGYSHEGVDLPLTTGTPIYAAYDGRVAMATLDDALNGGYGYYVRTYHPDLDICFFYAHFNQLKVTTGQYVKQGDLLGYSGSSGNSTGPHLHFSCRWMVDDNPFAYQPNVSSHKNSTIDPLSFLRGWLSAKKKVQYK